MCGNLKAAMDAIRPEEFKNMPEVYRIFHATGRDLEKMGDQLKAQSKEIDEQAQEAELFEEIAEKTEEKPLEKQSFFSKLAAGLSKTKSAITDRVDSVLGAFKAVDEELFEELEEALIMADIGVDTSLYIIGELRTRAKKENIKERGG